MKANGAITTVAFSQIELDMVYAMLVKNAQIIQSAIIKIEKSTKEEISDVKPVQAGRPVNSANGG